MSDLYKAKVLLDKLVSVDPVVLGGGYADQCPFCWELPGRSTDKAGNFIGHNDGCPWVEARKWLYADE